MIESMALRLIAGYVELPEIDPWPFWTFVYQTVGGGDVPLKALPAAVLGKKVVLLGRKSVSEMSLDA